MLEPGKRRTLAMKHLWLSLLIASASFAARADIVVPMTLVDENGIGAPVGTVTISETVYGLVFTPSLAHLKQGLHGFHVHEKPSCAPGEKDGKKVAALGAGGHYDPKASGKHG